MSSFLKQSTSNERTHVQVHKSVSIHAKRGVVGLGILVHLLMVPQVGFAGKALLAQQAGEGLLFGVDPSMTNELSGHPERLPALLTLVAFRLCVNSLVVLESHQVSELFLADRAGEGARFVAVLVVEEGAGVAVSAAAVLADVALFFRASGVVTRL